MITYNITSKTNHWSRRVKKVDYLIKKILIYKKELNFKKNINYYCNFVLTNDRFVKNLNRKFKKNNQSTDVLTFVSKFNLARKKTEKHCDIFLSVETITKDAKKNKIDFYNHLAHLIVHSFLHINDYMHIRIKDFLIMKNKEINILSHMGITNPYN